MSLNTDQLMEIINMQTLVVQQGLDLSAVMYTVAEKAMQLTHSDGAVIEIEDNDEMVYRVAHGIAAHQLGLRINKVGSLTGLCMSENKALICEDSETDPRVNRNACRNVGLRSMAVIPLRHEHQCVGVLKVISAHTYAYDHNSIVLLNLMSELIAASIFNATRFESSELFKRATTDYLTDLPNRALFYDRLRQRIAQARRLDEPFAVLSIDLDGLKVINDTHGHRSGDAFIKESAYRMSKTIRSMDTLARLGGDEFAMIIQHYESLKELDKLVSRINKEIAQPFHFETHDIPLSVSIGYSIYYNSLMEADDLLETADNMMYFEKRKKKEKLNPSLQNSNDDKPPQ